MRFERKSKNVHVNYIKTHKRTKVIRYMLMSDVHWDNPKCNRELLKSDLDHALAENIPVLINGDLFCLMQGKGDPRRSKDDILPEHNNGKYLDSIVETAVEWFAPYAEVLSVIGYGNHETGIIKHQETDVLDRFVFMMNQIHKPENPIHIGGYGGWIVTSFDMIGSHKIKYYHGSGGGGDVTGGAISQTRMQTMIHGADVIWQGHIHENEEREKYVESLDLQHNIQHKSVLHITTPTYKEEYGAGYSGFHVEKRRPIKPLGCRILEITGRRLQKDQFITQRSYKI